MSNHENNSNVNKIQPLNNGIHFTFLDSVRKGFFEEKTHSGIIVDIGSNHNYSSKYARLGIVKAVGPEVQNISIGDTIAIKPLMWSHSPIVVEEGVDPIWLTDTRNVIGFVQ